MTDTLHPFERSGLGIGPFRFLFCASLPSPSLAEQNPEAYNAALRALPRVCPLGSCAHCGMPLVHNFVCVSSDGNKFAVGSECVAKTADKALGDKVAIAAAKVARDARRAKAQAKREASRAAWLVANAPRLEREAAERAAREEAAKAERAKVAAQWAFILPILDVQNGSFCASIAQSIRDGFAPTARARSIVCEIFCKQSGRAGSKAFAAAEQKFEELVGEAQQ